MRPWTEDEEILCRNVGFDATACLRIREIVASPLERLWGLDPETGEDIPIAGLSVPGDEPVRDQLQSVLKPLGYLAFGYQKRQTNGLTFPGWHVGILKSSDPCDVVRVKQTDGCNYHISTEEILAKLEAWKQISEFEAVAADHDFVELVFSRLPENICAFAEEVYRLCPDTVGQGVGLIDIQAEAERLQAAEALCPELSDEIQRYDPVEESMQRFFALAPPEQRAQIEANFRKSLEEAQRRFQPLMAIAKSLPHPSQEQGIKLLAHSIFTSHRLYLWWD